jgi:hypothetical protein
MSRGAARRGGRASSRSWHDVDDCRRCKVGETKEPVWTMDISSFPCKTDTCQSVNPEVAKSRTSGGLSALPIRKCIGPAHPSLKPVNIDYPKKVRSSRFSQSRRGRPKKKETIRAERRGRHGRREPGPPRGRPRVPRPQIRRRGRPKGSIARFLCCVDSARSVTRHAI